MSDISSILVEVGARLREERERLGLNQSDFGQLGGVNRGSQAEYELGKRPFSINYLFAVRDAGVDALFIIDGRCSANMLSDEQTALTRAYAAIQPAEQDALRRLASSLAGQPAPPARISLPSTAALQEGLAAFLEASPGLQGDELVRELAMSLPTILRGAEDELASNRSDQNDIAPSHLAAPDADRRGAQQGRRT